MSDTDESLVPVRDGMVVGVAGDPAGIGLLGSRCEDCGEISIGTNSVCLNCGGDRMRGLSLSTEGVVWTYTIVRHKPPGEYLGPDPFEPFALGLVELPEGVRIMAPLEGDIDSFRIGTRVKLRPWILRAADGTAYRAFRFAQVDELRKRDV